MDEGMIKGLRHSIATGRTYKKSNVYRVGQSILAKTRPRASLRNEYRVGRFCYGEGIAVHKMYGVVGPDPVEERTTLQRPISTHYLLMDFIEGETLFSFKGRELTKLLLKRNVELEKVLALGILPQDSLFFGNCIVGREGSINLIDFEDWYEASSEDLEGFRRVMEVFTEECIAKGGQFNEPRALNVPNFK